MSVYGSSLKETLGTDLKTSKTITGAELKTNFEVLDSKIASDLKNIINGVFSQESSVKRNVHRKKTFSYGKVGRIDDPRVLQGQTPMNPRWSSMKF